MTPAPDLGVSGFSLARVVVSASSVHTVYLCVNKDPLGGGVNRGNFVRVENVGTGDAPPHNVELGIVNVGNGVSYPCAFQLRAPEALGSGQGEQWVGPLCCPVNGSQVSAGDYVVYVVVDPVGEVAEMREDNNRQLASGKFRFP